MTISGNMLLYLMSYSCCPSLDKWHKPVRNWKNHNRKGFFSKRSV